MAGMHDWQAIGLGYKMTILSTLLTGLVMPPATATAMGVQTGLGPTAVTARVAGTGGDGLLVRAGPGLDFVAEALLPEGTTVQIVRGPRFDGDGRDWYLVTGYDQAGAQGWTAGEFLDPPDIRASRSGTVQAAGVGSRAFSATVTAYSWQQPGNGANGTITKSGTVAHWGTVAVDPRVIPLGSHLQIEGFDTLFVAEDTGGAVVGDRVEIFFPDEASAFRFGVHTLVVTVVDRTSPAAPPHPGP